VEVVPSEVAAAGCWFWLAVFLLWPEFWFEFLLAPKATAAASMARVRVFFIHL